ncbi:hypothetical protein C805_02084 [Eubacterium sp. 14-2]|nr:hypothetical protein C805_02084 [Eubacterium sp. 14-2]
MEGRGFQILEKAVALIKLNFLWVVCSLPLITGGAALCALHVMAVKILKEEEGYVVRGFWEVYRKKMKLSMKLWIPFFTGGIILCLDYLFWRNTEGDFAGAMRGFVCVLSGLWLVLAMYMFPLAARMDTKAGVAWRNGILLMFKYLPQSLYLLFFTVLFLTAGLLWTPVFYVVLLAGGSLLAVVHGKMLLWIFEKERIL